MPETTIRYLNTDLDLSAKEDLRPLVRALSRKGLHAVHVEESKPGEWFACMETNRTFRKADPNLRVMLSAIERLGMNTRSIWSRCALKEFNIGYDCGEKPWAFNQGISAETLRRLAQTEASLRITLYPAANDESAMTASTPTA